LGWPREPSDHFVGFACMAMTVREEKFSPACGLDHAQQCGTERTSAGRKRKQQRSSVSPPPCRTPHCPHTLAAQDLDSTPRYTCRFEDLLSSGDVGHGSCVWCCCRQVRLQYVGCSRQRKFRVVVIRLWLERIAPLCREQQALAPAHLQARASAVCIVLPASRRRHLLPRHMQAFRRFVLSGRQINC
jgi:hypothetical protein